MASESTNSLKENIAQALQQCRLGTLRLIESLSEEALRTQPHPEFSPVGWHLGHIAYTEAFWLLERCAGLSPQFPEYRKLFAADGLPKTERVNLPSLSTLYEYLETIRSKVLYYLDVVPLQEQEKLWRFIIQHESQHSEIITFLLQYTYFTCQSLPQIQGNPRKSNPADSTALVEIPAGEFERGNDSLEALDNEKQSHRVYLDTYWIDAYPVTCGQYRGFMEAGGYENPQWWSQAGWKWLQQHPVYQPLYWIDNPAWDTHPVCGVSWYEAEAYCNFVGKRLPTEAEWEKAACWDVEGTGKRTYPWGEQPPTVELCHCSHLETIKPLIPETLQTPRTKPVNAYPKGASAYGVYDLLGNVWEWTGSWFEAYPGFQFYPYAGYSKTYFDGKHRVLKGGSWATRPWALRCSFRNWYYPNIRKLFAGFRCVQC